jgi:outer membrane protein TolC
MSRRLSQLLAGPPAFALLLAAQNARAQAGPLTLDAAVRLALNRNERARIADLNVTSAEAGVEHARTGFLPTLVLSANDSDHPFATPPPRGTAPPKNVVTSTLTLTQPLVNAPAWPLYAQAKQELASTRAQTIDDKRLLGFDTARAFFNVLTAAAVLKAADRSLQEAKADLDDTQARVQAQLTSSNDATRAQIDLASAQRQVEIDRGNLDNARISLSYLIDAPVNGDLASPTAVLQVARRPAPALGDLVKAAFKHRPDLVAKLHASKAAHDYAEEPLLRLVPSVNLTGEVQGTTNTDTTGRWDEETIGVNLTWTLYDAGARYADKHARDAAAEIADLNLRSLARSVTTDVQSAVASLSSAQATLTAAQQTVTAARQSAEETGILYRQGLAKAIELVDANDERFEAEVNYANAEFQVAVAYLSLRQALGLQPIGTELR